MESKYLVSIVEASKMFGIGRDSLYAMSRSEPDIPIIKIGSTTKVNVPLKDNFISKKQEFQVKNILNNLICLKDILKTFTHEIQGRN